MATCGFCKKKITKEDIKKNRKDCLLKLLPGLAVLSCPYCDSILGTVA